MRVARHGNLLIAGALAYVSFIPPLCAEYLVKPGDVIEVAVAGVSELRQRPTVNIDGTISLSLIGEVKVAGETLPAVREAIRSRLATKVLHITGTGGQSYDVVFDKDQITADIVEYRPVYMIGDVARPGQQVFRPGLTVKQAISLAGGYDPSRFRVADPFIQSADLRAEYHSLWTDLAREHLRLARLKAEQSGTTSPEFTIPESPLSKNVQNDLIVNIGEQFRMRVSAFETETGFLSEAIKQNQEQYNALAEQLKKEREGVSAEMAELDKMLDLEKRGNTTASRVTDARRSVMLSSTRFLQTTAQVAIAQRELNEVMRRKQELIDRRSIENLREQEDASAKLAVTRSRLQSVSEKLLYAGVVRSQWVRGSGGKLELFVTRATGGTAEKIPATEETVLEPGDTVDVSLLLDAAALNIDR